MYIEAVNTESLFLGEVYITIYTYIVGERWRLCFQRPGVSRKPARVEAKQEIRPETQIFPSQSKILGGAQTDHFLEYH